MWNALFQNNYPFSRFPNYIMKSALVDEAAKIITDPQVLINLVSQRVRQLNSGRSPLIDAMPSMGIADIALTEIIEGKLKLLPASDTVENRKA